MPKGWPPPLARPSSTPSRGSSRTATRTSTARGESADYPTSCCGADEMKREFLEILRCPECITPLDLAVTEEERGEVKTGQLTCRDGKHTYQVSRFVPRFVDADKYADSFSLQRKYVRKHFSHYEKDRSGDELFFPTTGFSPEGIKEGLTLEIGAGYGRFVDVVQRAGGRIVGVDLSTHSIDLAQDFAGFRPNV